MQGKKRVGVRFTVDQDEMQETKRHLKALLDSADVLREQPAVRRALYVLAGLIHWIYKPVLQAAIDPRTEGVLLPLNVADVQLQRGIMQETTDLLRKLHEAMQP